MDVYPLTSTIVGLLHMGMLIAYLLGILTTIKPEDQNRGRDSRIPDSHQSQPFPQGPISVVCIPRTLSDQEQAEKKKSKRRKSAAFWVQVGSLILLFVYAGFTILIWRSMKKDNDLSRQQLFGILGPH